MTACQKRVNIIGAINNEINAEQPKNKKIFHFLLFSLWHEHPAGTILLSDEIGQIKVDDFNPLHLKAV